MRHLKGHKTDVRTVAFMPDGRLVSGGSDGTVRVWEVVTGECVTAIKAKAPVYAVAVRPTDAVIAYAGRYRPRADSNFVYLCDATGKALGQREVRREGLVWGRNPDSGGYSQLVRPVPRSIWSLAFSADGTYLAAAFRAPGGGNIPNGAGGNLWRDVRRPLDTPLAAHDAYALTFAPAGTGFAISRASAVEFSPAPDQPPATRYPLTANWAPALAFVPGADLAVIGSNSFLYLVCPSAANELARLKVGMNTIAAVAASPDGTTTLVGGRSGIIEVYDVSNRSLTRTYDFRIGGLHALAYAPDGLTFAAAGDNGLVVCDVDEV